MSREERGAKVLGAVPPLLQYRINKMSDMKNKNWWVYLLRCSDGTYYCGATTDVDRRVAEHNRGVAAKYTRGRGPVQLIAKSEPMSKGAALSLEAKVKKADKKKKPGMVEGKSG